VTEWGLDSFHPATPSGRENIHALLERQNYRLAWWGTAGDEINWRRFFDINGLAGLRVEVAEVFEATHATLFRLYAEGLLDGFRVDHVDGLSDPPGYCRLLRQRLDDLAPQRPPGAAQGRAYLVIEKILGVGEVLPANWGVDGTTGYDFMNDVSALQHDPGSEAALAELWHRSSHRPAAFEDEEVPARQEILQRGFDSSLRAVTRALHRIARSDPRTRDVSAPAIRRGLIALLTHFPVYRGYDAGQKRSDNDEAAFSKALAAAKQASPKSAYATLDHIDRWLGGEEGCAATFDVRRLAGTLFQQLSAPVAAKAVEDTAFYRYGRLLSRNDVGFDAARLGGSVAEFHRTCVERLAAFPDAMLATATHDHKRGEDLRARLAVLSEIPSEWAAFLERVRQFPCPVDRPDPGDEIMLLQMIVGAWPLDLVAGDDAGVRAFATRLAGWQEKALREAKLRTDWTAPDETYEATSREFLFHVLSPGSPFRILAHSFAEHIAPAGAVNGLAQAALKLTVPGMPDFYQGTELWDFSLVDPDNRRPVDYDARRAALAKDQRPETLLPAWRDGRIKPWMIRTTLRLRSVMPELFSRGDYIPLSVKGPLEAHIVAFARTHARSAMLVIAPRLAHQLLLPGGLLFNPTALRGSMVMRPDQLRGCRLQPLFANHDPLAAADAPVRTLLGDFPIAILHSNSSV